MAYFLLQPPKSGQLINMQKRSESGQIVVIALLAMVVILAIALAIVGRSLLDISASTQTEQSSRAFSAAEAGLEAGLQNPDLSPSENFLSFGNNAEASLDINASIPEAGLPLEHPPIGKDSFAQFWLANPAQDPPSGGYQEPRFRVYFGAVIDSNGQPINYITDPEDQPALELMVVYFDSATSTYKSTRYLYDSYPVHGNATDTARSPSSTNPSVTNGGFAVCNTSANGIETNTAGHLSNFYCQAEVPADGSSLPSNLVMVRARILYSSLSHAIAVGPDQKDINNPSYNIPKQATIAKSTGTVGNVQRSIEVFKQQSVMPQFLDYALFSASTLSRQ